MAREADMVRTTRTDATQHAKPRGRACEAHTAQVVWTHGRRTCESTQTLVRGATWHEGCWREGPTS